MGKYICTIETKKQTTNRLQQTLLIMPQYTGKGNATSKKEARRIKWNISEKEEIKEVETEIISLKHITKE